MEIVMFILIYLLVYFVYLILILKDKKGLEKFQTSMEIKYLNSVYKIKVNDKNFKKLANVVANANAIIISLTVSIVSFVDNIILKMISGFVVLILLQMIVYHIIGKILKKKEGNYNV